MSIEANLRTVQDNITDACRRAGRDPALVRLVVVTKTAGPAVIEELLALGVNDIGEGRVQDALSKHEAVPGLQNACFHMIGHLQRNKAKQAVRIFDMVQSVDSLRLAQAINQAAESENCRMPVLLEVNVSGEASKHGFTPDDARRSAKEIIKLPHLDLQGLMTMAPFDADESILRNVFASLRDLKSQISVELGVQMPHLSMGMSQDYELAIEEGATLVRVGTAIVG